MSLEPTAEPRFDVAVSFAGEDRSLVEEVVRGVNSDRVYYDDDYSADMWGHDLIEYFTKLYKDDARYVVIFVSAKYAEKEWTRLERRSALAGALKRKDPYVLPVRLDDTELDGLLPTVAYLDARRVGITGIVDAINAKLTGVQVALPTRRPLLDGKVPRSDAAVQALIADKPGGWEYLLYAALLMVNVNKYEDVYRDHTMAYAPRHGAYVTVDNLNEAVQSALGSARGITDNFSMVLDDRVQEFAFGPPGTPGNVEAIQHMAERFGSVYHDFMQWSRDLRGIRSSNNNIEHAFHTFAHASDQPIEAMRDFVRNFVRECDTVNERLDRGEKVAITMTVTLDLDDRILNEFLRHIKLAYKQRRQ